jgi:hypothetical protein
MALGIEEIEQEGEKCNQRLVVIDDFVVQFVCCRWLYSTIHMVEVSDDCISIGVGCMLEWMLLWTCLYICCLMLECTLGSVEWMSVYRCLRCIELWRVCMSVLLVWMLWWSCLHGCLLWLKVCRWVCVQCTLFLEEVGV